MLQRVSGALFVAFLVFVTALAQGQPIELTAPPPRSAAPGEIITLTFLAINRGTAPDTYLFSVSAPAGFQTLGALPPLTLAAGAQEPVFVTLIISQETPAGTYSVTLEATSQSDPSVRATAQATVTVERVAGVVVRAPDAKEVDPGSEVVLSFSVTNRGNVIDAFRLEAFTPRGFFTKVEPGIVELLPGETRSVLVTVRVPPDVPAGFEAVTLTAVSLRSEGVQGSGATTLIILPPEASKVPTALHLQAPAELSISTNSALNSKTFTQLSFFTLATMPEEQRLRLRLKISEQDAQYFLTNSNEFLFTFQERAFYFYLGDLPRLPLFYNALPRRGVELGFNNVFSLSATFEREQQAFALNFFGPSLNGSIARLIDVNLANPYVLTAIGFRNPVVTIEGAVAETGNSPQYMMYIRTAPNWGSLVIGFEFLRVEPLFPTLIGIPAVLRDTILWTIFSNIGVGPIAFSSLLSLKHTDIANDFYFQSRAVSSRSVQSRLIMRLPGLPSLSFEINQVLKRSDDPDFPPLSTDEETKMVTTADLSGPVGYIVTFRHYLLIDNINDAPGSDTSTIELNSFLIAHRLLGTEGFSLTMGLKRLLQTDINTGVVEHTLVLTARVAFITSRASASLWLGFNDGTLVGVGSQGFFGSLSFSFVGPPDILLSLTFTEPASLSVNAEVRVRFAMPFESVIIKGRVEGTLFIDLNSNGARDPGEPGVADALLRLDNQLARTDAQGYFRFPPVDPGSYKVEIARAPLGLVPTVAIPINVTVAVGQVVTLEIPMRSVAIIRGRVFDDKNRNGQLDPNEPGLPNVRVFAVGAQTFEARSGSDGQYVLQVPPGSYTVTLDRTTLPKRYEPTTPLTQTVTVQTGQTVTVDFGAYEVPRPVLFAPIADFTFTPAQPKVGERVIFDASASTDSDGQIVKYEWDFDGDGTVDATGKIVEHIFTRAGDFPVRLTVTDNDNLQNSVTKVVPVRP
jgi:hypothetical protein